MLTSCRLRYRSYAWTFHVSTRRNMPVLQYISRSCAMIFASTTISATPLQCPALSSRCLVRMAWLPLKAPRWQYHVDYPLWSIAVVTALYTPTETRPQQHIMYYLPDRMSLSSFVIVWQHLVGNSWSFRHSECKCGMWRAQESIRLENYLGCTVPHSTDRATRSSPQTSQGEINPPLINAALMRTSYFPISAIYILVAASRWGTFTNGRMRLV